MKRFGAPALSFVLGLALLAYGTAHSIRCFPGTEAFRVVLTHLPEATAIALFLAGIAAAIGGVSLMISGGRGVRARWTEIDRACGNRSRPRHYDEDDWYRADAGYQ